VAIGARLAGATATVLDRRAPPIDKACGEGLMPDGVAALARLGIEPAQLGGRPFRGIRYVDRGRDGGEGTEARGEFPGGAGRGGLGVRRTRLHAALARRAAEVGVDARWGVTVRGLVRGDPAPRRDGGCEIAREDSPAGGRSGGDRFAVATDDGPLAGRWLVAADGLHSPLRRWAGLDGPPARRRRFGVRRHFRIAPWSDCVEVWWARGCEAYVTPVAADEVGVALLWSAGETEDPADGEPSDDDSAQAGPPASDDPPATPPSASPPRAATWDPPPRSSLRTPARPTFPRLLAAFPRLAARLAGAPAVSRDRGAGPLERRPRAVWRGNLALVGDASGYLDAITGEGLALAFHQAEALVEALRGGDLAPYAAAHRRLRRLPDAFIALLLAVERRPWLRRRMIRALAAEPALFSRLLGVHARSVPLAEFGVRGAARLAWGLARG
jgi:flavin-dependent dehydrogenase